MEPVLFDEVVYQDNVFLIKKICFWEKCSLSFDKESGYFQVLLPGGKSFNFHCIGTYALSDGRRATDKIFHYIGDFSDGLAKVVIPNQGYGFINMDFNLVCPPVYSYASDYINSFAIVSYSQTSQNIFDAEVAPSNNKTMHQKYILLDNNGKEHYFDNDYAVVNFSSESLFLVSTIDFGGFYSDDNFAFHSDYSKHAGIWGYADSNGMEIISPQYIYAHDFINGLALVAKGKWEKRREWNNRYWSEEMLWGMIDKKGNEIIPCKFDEIKHFNSDSCNNREDESSYLMAHFGGWDKGKWGIIDYKGNWVIEPIFEDFGYDIYNDDLIIFYNEDKWATPDDLPMGVYSIKEKRIIFEPQFMDVDFFNDGIIRIEKYDNELGYNIEKLIDLNGNPLFPSDYTSIWPVSDGKYYEVSK